MKFNQMYFFNLILLLVIVIQLSCTNSNIGQNIVSFNIGYPTSRINAGEICFKNDTNLYLYFCNPRIAKNIAIYKLNGEKVYDIPIKKNNFLLDDIEDFYIKSLDTIYLFTNKNRIITINKEGIILNIKSFRKLINKEKDCVYGLESSLTQDFYYNNSFYFGLLLDKINNPYNDSTEKVKNIKYYYAKNYSKPFILKINNLDSITYGLKGFYNRISDSNHLLIERTKMCFFDSNLFMYSNYTDTIYKLNIENLEIVDKYRITSKKTKIYMNPIEINNNTIENLQDLINNNFKEQGRIVSMYYNSEKARFYIGIKHEQLDYSKGDIKFSVLVYDKNFAFINESEVFSSMDVIFTKKGILVPIINNRSHDQKSISYKIYDL